MTMNNQVSAKNDPLYILLIGNNPIDMSNILDKINQITSARVITEIAFDLKSIMERLMRFKPNFILIDDNIGKALLSETVETLSHRHNTRNVPITVLKNSNYEESYAGGSMLDYLLKTNLSPESLYNTVRNSVRFRKTHLYLYGVYKKRRGIFKSIKA